MSYLVLARKCRPGRFDEVVGQTHVTRTLANAIKMDRVAHGFVFSGVRGVGKTSLARILAKSLNCAEGPTVNPCGKCESCRSITAGTAVDVIEIDGASNNSVDDIRDLRETVPYRPVIGRYKIYVIDEVHMLSVSAFNALLKTLEEPPDHVKFIFATTEPHKIPMTILSRCQRYDFRRIPTDAIITRIRSILKDEGIDAEDGSLAIIGREAEGSMRDALSILDQVLASGETKITATAVTEMLGVVSRSVLYNLSSAVLDQNPRMCLEIVRDVDRQGFDIPIFAKGLLEHLRNLVVAGVCEKGSDILDLPEDELADLKKQTQAVSNDTLHRLFKHFSEAYEEIARSSHSKILLETTLARLADMGDLIPASDILRRLEALAAGRPRGGSPGPGSSAPRSNPAPASGTDPVPGAKQSLLPTSVQAPTPTQTATASNLSSSKDWKRLLADFSQKYPAKASIIERAEPAADSTEEVLILQFDKGDIFASEQAGSPVLQKQLTNFVKEYNGRSVRLKVRTCDLSNSTTLAKTRLEQQAQQRKRDDEAKEHPVVRGIVTTFGGAIGDVKITTGTASGSDTR